MEKIINDEHDWDHSVSKDAIEGPVDCVSRYEVVQALNKMEIRTATGPSYASLELIASGREVGSQVMAE